MRDNSVGVRRRELTQNLTLTAQIEGRMVGASSGTYCRERA